ncbi:ester cyclase [Amycolatopsis minnesotensis]|uniref:Ester cyclase n=1 Tax=Amycolatopsis minnesotensis TaxID=337894 RepID=A0ABP5BWC6_9PSEU
MTPASNKAVVRRWLDILETREYERLDDILAENVYDHDGERPGVAWWREVRTKLDAMFSETSVTVHDLVAEGDRVAARFTVTGVHSGDGMPQLGAVPATGKRFEWAHMHLFRFSGAGRIIEHWAVRDDLGPAIQLGLAEPVSPPPPPA